MPKLTQELRAHKFRLAERSTKSVPGTAFARRPGGKDARFLVESIGLEMRRAQKGDSASV